MKTKLPKKLLIKNKMFFSFHLAYADPAFPIDGAN